MSDDPQVQIEESIKLFSSNLEKLEKREKKLEDKRKSFVDTFTPERIKSMSKEDYVVGLGSKTSFCYRIENDLKDLGDIHGAYSEKFGLYFNRDANAYKIAGNKFGSDEDEALSINKEDKKCKA